jgi:hypothetical protein
LNSTLIVLFLSLAPLFAREHGASGFAVSEKETLKPAQGQPAQLSRDDVLGIKDGRFFLDGKPFAEVSFNKYDLFW